MVAADHADIWDTGFSLKTQRMVGLLRQFAHAPDGGVLFQRLDQQTVCVQAWLGLVKIALNRKVLAERTGGEGIQPCLGHQQRIVRSSHFLLGLLHFHAGFQAVEGRGFTGRHACLHRSQDLFHIRDILRRQLDIALAKQEVIEGNLDIGEQ